MEFQKLGGAGRKRGVQKEMLRIVRSSCFETFRFGNSGLGLRDHFFQLLDDPRKLRICFFVLFLNFQISLVEEVWLRKREIIGERIYIKAQKCRK